MSHGATHKKKRVRIASSPARFLWSLPSLPALSKGWGVFAQPAHWLANQRLSFHSNNHVDMARSFIPPCIFYTVQLIGMHMCHSATTVYSFSREIWEELISLKKHLSWKIFLSTMIVSTSGHEEFWFFASKNKSKLTCSSLTLWKRHHREDQHGHIRQGLDTWSRR